MPSCNMIGARILKFIACYKILVFVQKNSLQGLYSVGHTFSFEDFRAELRVLTPVAKIETSLIFSRNILLHVKRFLIFEVQ